MTASERIREARSANTAETRKGAGLTREAAGLTKGQARYLVGKIQRTRKGERVAWPIRCLDDTYAVYSDRAPKAIRV